MGVILGSSSQGFRLWDSGDLGTRTCLGIGIDEVQRQNDSRIAGPEFAAMFGSRSCSGGMSSLQCDFIEPKTTRPIHPPTSKQSPNKLRITPHQALFGPHSDDPPSLPLICPASPDPSSLDTTERRGLVPEHNPNTIIARPQNLTLVQAPVLRSRPQK